MTIGASLFLIAVGAILKYAVSDGIDGVDLGTIGLILLLIGVLGLILGLFLTFATGRRDDVVVERRRADVPPDPRL